MYYTAIMKNTCFFIGLLICLLLGSIAFASDSQKYANARAAQREARQSSDHRFLVCNRIIVNFRRDATFTRAINNYCGDNEASMLNLKQAIYPLSNNDYKNYRNVYPYVSSQFVIESNNAQLQYLKKVVQDYCKYNAFKVLERDPKACSSARIESLFAQ